MSLGETLRNLITNSYDPEIDYFKIKFSFETSCQMFPGTQYTLYEGCSCSIEHEFMLYYTKDGTFEEEIYNRVIQNIIAGKCPHVQDTTPIVTTSVGGIYIAAAINIEGAILKHAATFRPKK